MKFKVEANAFSTADVVLSCYPHSGPASLFMLVFGSAAIEKSIII